MSRQIGCLDSAIDSSLDAANNSIAAKSINGVFISHAKVRNKNHKLAQNGNKVVRE